MFSGNSPAQQTMWQSTSPAAWENAQKSIDQAIGRARGTLNTWLNPTDNYFNPGVSYNNSNIQSPNLSTPLNQLFGQAAGQFQNNQGLLDSFMKQYMPTQTNAGGVSNNVAQQTGALNNIYGQGQQAIGQQLGTANSLQQQFSQPQAPLYNMGAYSQGLSSAYQNALNSFNTSFGGATGAINQNQAGVNQAANQLSTNPSLYNQSSQQGMATGAFDNALQQYQGLTAPAASQGASIAEQFKGVQDQFNPYISTGQQSSNQLNTLAGGQGVDAQKSAMDAILSNPILQGQADYGKRLVENSNAAKGLLGSGNVMMDLQKFGQSLSGDAYNQYVNQLNNNAALGQSASNSVLGSLSAQNNAQQNQGNSVANLITGGEQNRFNQLSTMVGQQQQSNQAQQGQQLQALGLGSQNAQALAGLNTNQGTNVANLFTGGQATGFNQQSQMVGQQQAANLTQQSNQLQAAGLGSSNAGLLSNLLQNQAGQTANVGNNNTNSLMSLLGMQQGNAGNLAGVFQNQASGLTGALQQQFSNQMGQYDTQYQNQFNSALQQYMAKINANQTYANAMTNLDLTQGNYHAGVQLGKGQQMNMTSFYPGGGGQQDFGQAAGQQALGAGAGTLLALLAGL